MRKEVNDSINNIIMKSLSFSLNTKNVFIYLMVCDKVSNQA